MIERMPPKYAPYDEIRTNRRFSTFQGRRGDQEVFIKIAVDPKLQERLAVEAHGLAEMKKLDPSESLFRLPRVIELHADYLATSWVDGTPMAADFENHDANKIESDIAYLTRLYAFVDQGSRTQARIEYPSGSLADKHMKNLVQLGFDKYINADNVTNIAEYIRVTGESVETRPTNGDLQPGNILLKENDVPTLVDFESYSNLWPRHYNIVNFVFNYGADYPEFSDKFKEMMVQYGQAIGVDPYKATHDFNISAAIRCMQMIEERISDKRLDKGAIKYIEGAMKNILDGRLFIDQG